MSDTVDFINNKIESLEREKIVLNTKRDEFASSVVNCDSELSDIQKTINELNKELIKINITDEDLESVAATKVNK